MRPVVSAVTMLAVVVLLVGVASAWMGSGHMGMGMKGPGMMGGAASSSCPGMATDSLPSMIDSATAKALVEEYTARYLPGFAVESVLPFAGRHMTMYGAELKGPDGETRNLHVTPWGDVMPFGPPAPR